MLSAITFLPDGIEASYSPSKQVKASSASLLFGVAAGGSGNTDLALEQMIELDPQPESAPEFRLALDQLLSASFREELKLEEIPAPSNLATHAVAFSANVVARSTEDVSTDSGTGRMVLLWDPVPQESWESNFRTIIFAKSPLETDIGSDDMIADVAWAWLTEALNNRSAKYVAAAGTATRVISRGYGALAGQSDHAELEVRASWSPVDGFVGAHLEAWQDLLCIMSGFPHLPAGVFSIDSKFAR